MKQLVKTGLAAVLTAALSSTGMGEAAPKVQFSGQHQTLDNELRKRITGSSWHRGCPVPRRNLRLLKVLHWGFDNEVHHGRLIVHANEVRHMLKVMEDLFDQNFRIRRMRLVDAYGADDHRSMNADNTSAFNCREVAGSPGVWSEHAYGKAIDVNPIENPYVTISGHVSPPAGVLYADRTPHRRGMVNPGGKVVRIFAKRGWKWGDNWSGTKDYQHFSTSGH